jgi:two-component system, OmpR family, response regulator QseB
MTESYFLIVEHGTPFEKGAFITIDNPNIIIGRAGSSWKPDISFHNIFVSRKHVNIYEKNGHFYIKDLNSKHGTFINNNRLKPFEEFVLKPSDKISLSNLITLTFSVNLDATSELAPIFGDLGKKIPTEFYLDPLKQELKIQNTLYQFSEKEYKCIDFLIQNRNQIVLKEELVKFVWDERVSMNGQIPDVSNEEINTIIYRIRKKTGQNICIENIRRKGYLLSFVREKNRV